MQSVRFTFRTRRRRGGRTELSEIESPLGAACWAGTMRVPSSLKEEFAREWIPDLRSRGLGRPGMSMMEKRVAIKLSADTAMASARSRNGNPCWSHAVLAHAWEQGKSSSKGGLAAAAAPCRKKARRRKASLAAKSTARKMVRRRTRVLRCLVPGGESMDDFSLIVEALDYMVSLQAQVDVMRSTLAVSGQISVS